MLQERRSLVIKSPVDQIIQISAIYPELRHGHDSQARLVESLRKRLARLGFATVDCPLSVPSVGVLVAQLPTQMGKKTWTSSGDHPITAKRTIPPRCLNERTQTKDRASSCFSMV